MKELDDDASTEELTKSVSATAELVSDGLWEAEGRLQESRHSEEEIDKSLHSIRAFAEDILSSVENAEGELNTAMREADEACDGIDGAKSTVDTMSRHADLLVDRVTDDGEKASESEVEIDGTAYRLRLEPLEETDD